MKKIPVVGFIFRNSLKLKSKDVETVINVHRATQKFIPLISYITSEKDVQHAEAHCAKILIYVPETPKLRILADPEKYLGEEAISQRKRRYEYFQSWTKCERMATKSN